MKWCRIIEDGADQYLCAVSMTDQGPALVTSWMVGDMMVNAVLPPEEFSCMADACQFLGELRVENVLMLRRSAEGQQNRQAEVESAAVAAEVIARAKGLH